MGNVENILLYSETMFKLWLEKVYELLNCWSGGIPEIIKETLEGFTLARAAQSAAGLAYYALFSMFPMLLLFVGVGSYFLEGEDVSQRVVEFVTQALPISPVLLEENIDQVLQRRGTFSVIGIIGLLWSATAAFSWLGYHINLAWPEANRRNFVRQRLVGLSMVGVLAILFFFSLVISTLAKLIPVIQAQLFNGMAIPEPSWARSSLVWVLIFLMFVAMYRWIPATQVSWKASSWAALVATIMWQLASYVFTWYVRVGLGRYELIYGSLGAVVALLVLVYLIAWIILFGAHLCAAITHHQRRRGAMAA